MKKLKIAMLAVLFFSFCCASFAKEVPRMAVVKETKGTVEVKTPKAKWIPAQVGMQLNQGDILRTQKGSTALINLDGKGQTATVEIKENSQLRLVELLVDKEQDTQATLLDLALGAVLIKAQKLHAEKSRFEVKTPTSIIGVRGTTFSVTVEAVE